MTIPSWIDLEQEVSRALALEVVSASFPLPDRKTAQGLSADTTRVMTALRSLPAEFDADQLDAALARASRNYDQTYRDTLPQTLRSALSHHSDREVVIA